MSDSSASPLLDPTYARNPHPAHERLRGEDPVHYVAELGFWYLTRFDDVRRLFSDGRVTPDTRAWERYEAPPEGSFMRRVLDEGLFALSPEHHARIRKLVSVAFTPRAIARMEAQVQQIVGEFAGPLRGRFGVVDLYAELCDPVPNAVMTGITGIPPKGDDGVRFRRLAQVADRGLFTANSNEELRRQGEAAYAELVDWVRVLAVARRQEPHEDLVSDLVQARDGDDALSDDEVVMLISGLLAAGSETTANAALAGLRHLLRDASTSSETTATSSLSVGAPISVRARTWRAPRSAA